MNRVVALPAIILLGCSTGAAHAAAARAVADTWVYGASGFQDTNFGANPTIRVRTSGTRIGLVRFDTNALPTGSRVLLKMRVSTVNVGGLVRIHVVQQPWQERTVTFKTRPAFSSADVSTRNILPGDVGQIVSFDVTSAVTGWRANPASNFGLAIDARESRAEVFFASREGGTAPLLEGVGGVVRDGDVTVSKSGGDYSSPITAVQNAFEGDHWCTFPAIPACTMHIDAGVFVLPTLLNVPAKVDVVGQGKGETILAGKVVIDANRLTDLSIIARNPLLGAALVLSNDGAMIERVSVFIEGQGDVTAVNDSGGTVMTDSEIVALGGDHTFGFQSLGGGGFTISNSTIRVAGATQQGVGLEWHSDAGGGILIENSVVSVEGPGTAEGVIFNGDTGGASIIGSRILARSDTHAAALSSVVFASGVILEVRDTVLVARGPGGEPDTAVDYGPSSSNFFTFDRVTADGGIRINQDSLVDLKLLRSQVTSMEITLFEAADLKVQIDHSSVRNGLKLTVQSPGTLTATSSILGAPRTFTNVTATCTEVYDENLQLLPANCRAP